MTPSVIGGSRRQKINKDLVEISHSVYLRNVPLVQKTKTETEMEMEMETEGNSEVELEMETEMERRPWGPGAEGGPCRSQHRSKLGLCPQA